LKRHRRRTGFIVIVGWRVISRRDGKAVVRARCPHCNVEDAQLIGKVRRAWFTIFFIPIVPLDRHDRAERISQCRECKQTFDMPLEQLARRAGADARSSLSDTIVVYNELRERPKDGKTMLRLLKMYEQMGELSEAEAAARHFPDAIAADPDCGQLLEKMRATARRNSA
jgi:hypothetical protein